MNVFPILFGYGVGKAQPVLERVVVWGVEGSSGKVRLSKSGQTTHM